MNTKQVAIVGAGPGGLVAAKTLQHHSRLPFSVTLFERAQRLGGIWRIPEDGAKHDGFLSTNTPTNLSKFTVAFSDLSWDSVDLGLSVSDKPQKHGYSRVPMFPKAWMAGRYLELYADKYALKDKILFGTEIVRTERVRDGGSIKWKVFSRKTSGSDAHSEQCRVFDYLVVASGFFGRPKAPPPTLSPPQLPSNVRVFHSSQYRRLDDLIPSKPTHASPSKILIIGGGNSSGEAAGTVARDISSSIHSSTSHRNDLRNVEIVHVTPRPLYALPPFVPAAPGIPGFIPLDLRLYDFTARPGEIQTYGGKAPEEVLPIVHGFIRSMIGSDQSDLGSEALVASLDGDSKAGTAYVALSENYSEFVRSGLIKPVSGRVAKLDASAGSSTEGLFAQIVASDGRESTIDGITAVIHASGYTPAPALKWLPKDVLESVEYDPKSPRLPLILDMLQTYNSTVPDVGFIGFYEGPYWGVMEMQSRLLTETWASSATGKPFKTRDRAYEDKAALRSLRTDMESKDRQVPQYWFSDYLGYMEEAAVDLGLQRNDHPFEEHQGPTTPARYLGSETATPEAAKVMTDLSRTMTASKQGAFLARATLRALQGRWRLGRTIKSASGNLPSGTFSGRASFSPRLPTTDNSNSQHGAQHDGEHLYSEQGTFTPETGSAMQASRHYVYRYRESDDSLSVWFVKPDDLKMVDYLYHDVVFKDIQSVDNEGAKQRATATAEHLCEADLYKTEYEFHFQGINVTSWTCTHRVKGPAKDYVSEAIYER